ncbi:tRNA (adenosine(37)-N6)-dimethylallyltransferase MiaA [Coralliovum pocilloporae]|uniref:tRNA (adenosine(37)-N6)-dimethylallyltransferase MiaA n=1 Tax=Coralliovum pocilloporae TaxID=3066369 RepID=UPI003307816A
MNQYGIEAILLAGPTASGKSAFGLALAEALDGVIINADSMQVYSGLRIISARPSSEDEARAPHYLYGHVAPEQSYSVGEWLTDVKPLLERLRQQQRLPIILGGTGLYFSALLNGLSPIPDINPTVRQYWRSFLEDKGQDALFDALSERDPVMAGRLMPQDGQRIIRALEVLDQTGRSLADWQSEPNSPPLLSAERVARFVLDPPRELLYERINARFGQMVEEGGLSEVEDLLKRNLDPALPVMKAIGVPQLAPCLDGDCSLEEGIELARRDSRRYAKRQGTWFRNQFSDWVRLDARNFRKTIEEIRTCLEKRVDPSQEAD